MSTSSATPRTSRSLFQFSIGDAGALVPTPADACVYDSFNSLLEMQRFHHSTASTTHRGRVSILYWGCNDVPYRGPGEWIVEECFNSLLEMRASALRGRSRSATITYVSMLYWRCRGSARRMSYTSAIAFQFSIGDAWQIRYCYSIALLEHVSILYWRCCQRFQVYTGRCA